MLYKEARAQINESVINYLGGMENEVNDLGQETRQVLLTDIITAEYNEIMDYGGTEIRFLGKEKILGLIRKAIELYEEEYLEGYIEILNNEICPGKGGFEGNMHCDNTGYCSGISCPNYMKCRGEN